MRNLALTATLATLRVVLRALSRVMPQSRSVVVSAYPETEGNGVEVARALVDRYAGRVVWLRDGGPVPEQVARLVERGLVPVRKASPVGLWAYLRAETVLFTHGLYGSPRPVARKPVVNLWHGDGPKGIAPARDAGGLVASTWFVGSTSLFSPLQAATFGLPPERVLVTGNPRTDQLWREPAPGGLARLGITGDFVVWMPTFRRARAVGAMRVKAGPVAEDRAGLAELAAGLRARGLQLVVKPHPMDADRRAWAGALTVDEAALDAAGVTLYELLGEASGLVTDYSSVWVDYLLVDRPIAFLVPDRNGYDRDLVPPDVLDWVPGEVVDLAGRPFEEFFADVAADGDLGAERRRAVAERIGLTMTATAADDLVTRLAKLGVLASA
ncbi:MULTISPECIES: CDP-glycerol glycerophosphotransferase family protein [unclassified Nocardioides]|uniref:CDP-glycerol glycerophosphotransferase family protein n=1 Tax=unclassified Nocardioides TaxID=2615069 RepID=UPI00360BF37F